MPKDFYSTDFYTEFIIKEIEKNPNEPFFAYLAFTAPHNPLHAPERASIRKYRGRYDAGWDSLRSKREAALKAKGFVPQEAVSHASPDWIPAWNTLTPQVHWILTCQLSDDGSLIKMHSYA